MLAAVKAPAKEAVTSNETTRRGRAQRSAAMRARTQLATALQEEAQEALDDALDVPWSRQDGVRCLAPSVRPIFSPESFAKVGKKP